MDEPKTCKLVTDFCKKHTHGTFLDLGAHVGAYAIPIAKLGLKVIAVEPSPDTFKSLAHNAQLNNVNSNIVLVNAAAWDYDGTAKLYLSRLGGHGDSLLKGHSLSNGWVEVQTKSLSTLLDEVGELDIAKIDIERGELRVLKQAGDKVNRVSTWIIEVSDVTKRDIWNLMREQGFECRIIERLLGTKGTYNMLCTRHSS